MGMSSGATTEMSQIPLFGNGNVNVNGRSASLKSARQQVKGRLLVYLHFLEVPSHGQRTTHTVAANMLEELEDTLWP